PHAKALITGLSRESNKAHITRAALEAQAYQTADLFGAFEADTGHKVQGLRVDGGLVANKFVCQFLADMLRCPVDVPDVIETTALGAAYLAGLQAGIFKDLSDIETRWQRQNFYTPQMDEAQMRVLSQGWKKAVGMLR
ncbi:MAG: FGGY-family carbohydrate kinase, partial [Alphaproteobacteria bacterium]|nr:FGGY-family carbohydrate kinase [Alphaproteobacteria bacterium]